MPVPSPEDHYHFLRLDAAYDKAYSNEEIKAAIQYFHQKGEFPAYLLDPKTAFGLDRFRKSFWKNHLIVLEKWIDRREVMDFFVGIIDDENWPGYVFAWDSLVAMFSWSKPSIEKALEECQEVGRRKQLMELLEAIDHKEKELRSAINGWISAELGQRYSRHPQPDIFINRLNPVWGDAEVRIVYHVEFKVIKAHNDIPPEGLWTVREQDGRIALYRFSGS